MAAVRAVAAGEAGVAAADGGDGMGTNMKQDTIRTRVRGGLACASLAVAAAFAPLGVHAQERFATPEAAADALVDGIARHDGARVREVLGPRADRVLPKSVGEHDKLRFLEAWAQGHRIVGRTDARAMVEVGTHGWTLPIPLAHDSGGWSFDLVAAVDEMRARRIGRNELAAIQVSLAYVDAQREYVERDWDGDGVKSYAQRAISTRGRHDGLYWASLPGEPESPLGPAFADATPGMPYHGYAYRILTAQGAAAAGGAKNYVANGRMTGGFALVAWPAKYGDTGVMTFIVNQDGVVYQRDLGPDTATRARALRAFDPGPGWERADTGQ